MKGDKLLDAHNVFDRYEKDLKQVESNLTDIFKSDAVLIPVIGQHIIGGGGKRLRPLFLILAAAITGYIGDKGYIFASVIEAIHTASLLHDDVVDGAAVRRGKTTSHSIWGNHVVILVGDYLYANSLRIAVEQHDPHIVEAIAQAATKMTEGEILQLQKIADPSVTEQDYINIVERKTGSLFSASCRIGALLGGSSVEKVEALTSFGLKCGIVFQMCDDILDFQADESLLGKRLGKDLIEGKITLPLIYLLKYAAEAERNEVTDIIKSIDEGKTEDAVAGDMKRIISLLKSYDIIEKTYKRAEEIVCEAKAGLNLFDDSDEKEALMLIADYAMKRAT
ncbi:MAG: polyprenyl synthetase family protein [Nitrospirae bacterium]|nr:polyprenyl synthetase family protein [Nitrospirota bacterium]MBF0534096.1 polyprenyl synthetase family protein [Nitrospirota bacterium]MBF0618503.1 polyprenyl synthetase family protein [Nitrospirota bacterium]